MASEGARAYNGGLGHIALSGVQGKGPGHGSEAKPPEADDIL
jgi:hypothetical protein